MLRCQPKTFHRQLLWQQRQQGEWNIREPNVPRGGGRGAPPHGGHASNLEVGDWGRGNRGLASGELRERMGGGDHQRAAMMRRDGQTGPTGSARLRGFSACERGPSWTDGHCAQRITGGHQQEASL